MFSKHFDYLYLEPSSFCNVKCPRCPRTDGSTELTPQHLDLEIFVNFIRESQWENLKTVEYGGNLGDPLMNPQLPLFIGEVANRRPQAKQLVHTSGNHSMKLWEPVLAALKPSDGVLFSVDGLRDTNDIYRVGSRWDWIEEAMKACSNKVETTWKYIVFKHNQDQIFEAMTLAKEWGVQNFVVTKSHLFGEHWADSSGTDPMAPSENWIATAAELGNQIVPKCQEGSRHYLSAKGEYSPCCWSEPQPGFSWDLSKQSFSEILYSQNLLDIKNQWSSGGPQICKKKCTQVISKRSSHQQLYLDLSKNRNELIRSVEKFSKKS